MEHTCHADMCAKAVPPHMFMCRKHWYMVPRTLRNMIWLEYVPGQEIRKDPTPAYLDITAVAISHVAQQEGLK